ncbi:glycine zipper 2TM domain-containing protein [Basfia succiniciproducens]|uniref:glycine zipper 2TM domain-containing protein n=1 Tax=Basfia succiniciproducens TaxID=653940 RepID=UPI0008BD915E|nr:glycine zipper 2TM domain-containing protein [Basfia succiniciproducens]SEQ23577.1 Glycine zipper 2TM domain-containing protein [Basfia succiniciproducens]
MKSILAKGLILALLTTSVSAYALNRQQHDTVVGAALGGVAGAVLGNDVTSTVAGAALGGVVGSQWNANKQRDDHYRVGDRRHHRDFDRLRYEDRRHHPKERYFAHHKPKHSDYREMRRYRH